MQPLEELHAEASLEGFYLLPDSARRDVQLTGGELEAEMVCRGFERAKGIQWRQQIGHGVANMPASGRGLATDFL